MPSGSLSRRRAPSLVLSGALASAALVVPVTAFAQAPEGTTAAAPPPAPASGSAPVKIATSDGKGLIYVDDKLVGEGSFVAELTAGPHKLKVIRDGYDPFEEEITVKDKEPFARTITLVISSKVVTGVAETTDRPEGFYGGFSLMGVFTPGGTGSDMQKQCGSPPAELPGCTAPDGFGGGISGFAGYHWDPVGVELFLAGQYDERTIKQDWNAASNDPGFGFDPARHQDFVLRRAGGMGLLRVRLTLQTERLRFTGAIGAGLSKRVMFLQRDTFAPGGGDRVDLYVAESAGYWSPVIGFDPAVMFRLTHGIALGVGLQVLLETPSTFLSGNPKGENPQANRESGHAFPPTPQVPVSRGIRTPTMDLASDVQVYVGPYIGMMFGP